MKHLFNSFLFLFLIYGVLFSQETKTYDKVDETPMPVGGMSAIMKNIVYPELARAAGIQGKVIIEATIDEQGNVIETKVLQGVGSGLDESAITAIKKTKFTPGKVGDKAVKTKVAIPVQYKLDSGKKKEK